MQLGNLPTAYAQSSGGGMVAAMVNAEINRQAMMIAYLDDFWVMMWAIILVIPFIALVKPRRPTGGEKVVMVGE